MSELVTDITADAVALQERDEFRAAGWLKVIAPAKVNLHLCVGARRSDGYHEVTTVLHAVNLHDVVYVRRRVPADAQGEPSVRMVACGDVPVPEVPLADNLAFKAACALAAKLDRPADLDIRIEKNIPAQAGLGGGSTDAAAVLVGAARLWGVAGDDPLLEQVARELGSDVAFFLRGGCSLYAGAGERFVRALAPSKRTIALVKPAFGVSTAEAYQAFDANPPAAGPLLDGVEAADEVVPFNNLAPAAESLAPELSEIRRWLAGLPGVECALLCGSGSATLAVCGDFAAACRVVAAARERGLRARTSSLGSVRASAISEEGLS